MTCEAEARGGRRVPLPDKGTMNPAPLRTQNLHRTLRTLVAAGTIAGTAVVPSVARASSLPQPVVASTKSPLCTEVSAAAVSHVVGYQLPAAVAATSTVRNKKLDISGTFTDCTYGAYAMGGSPTVDLVYWTFSKAVPLSTFEQVISSGVKQMPGTHWTVKPYAGLGEPALLVAMSSKIGSSRASSEEISAIDGKKGAGAVVSEMAQLPKVATSLPLSKVAALTQLAMDKFF